MVCVPCIVIPVLLYIWHRFLQPIFLKFWNPWAKVIQNPVPYLTLKYLSVIMEFSYKYLIRLTPIRKLKAMEAATVYPRVTVLLRR